jgi:CubicO group peptidase (beta-lactamase class C family)
MKTKLIYFLLVATLINCTDSEKKQLNENGVEQLITTFENQIKTDIEQDAINGSVSATIIKGDTIIWQKTFGLNNSNDTLKSNSNTIYRVGSISKTFTGLLMMILHQEGVLNINDPIENYLPEIKNLKDYKDYEKITFKALASHTSGLDREPRLRDIHEGPIMEWESKVLQSIPETGFINKPSERFRYSNIGYGILGLALSKAANKSFIALVEEKILTPLKMESTFYSVPENKEANLAVGMGGGPLVELDFELPRSEHKGRGYKIPNGSIYSTPNDLAQLMICLMGYSNIINEENLTLLKSTQTPTKNLRQNYGFGVELYEHNDLTTISHAGSTPGYSAHFEFEPESEFGIVIMRNYNFGNTNFDLRLNALLRNLKTANKSL